jgi:xanthine dehydrogenase accessory factor
MTVTDAIFDGQAALAGVTAVQVDDLHALLAILASQAVIPAIVTDLLALLQTIAPAALVDARMRTHLQPEIQRGMAPLTIGLGPNFVAGETTDPVVETQWGDDLGQVLVQGMPQPSGGEPRPIAGHARDLHVYAPVAGVFRTRLHIGDPVRAGDPVAHLGAMVLTAPLDGMLRGLTRDGVPVTVRMRVIEVDPRGPAAVVTGLGERPHRIAQGVLQAVQRWVQARAKAHTVAAITSQRVTLTCDHLCDGRRRKGMARTSSGGAMGPVARPLGGSVDYEELSTDFSESS